jgi:hypothetical protein
MVGAHDLLNERVRQKVIDCRGVSIRHGGSPFCLGVRLPSCGGLTFQPQLVPISITLIPIGTAFVKSHEQRKIETASGRVNRTRRQGADISPRNARRSHCALEIDLCSDATLFWARQIRPFGVRSHGRRGQRARQQVRPLDQ